MADEEAVHPLNLLGEELKNENTEVRLKAIKRLKLIANALGTERTRIELIPFLNECMSDEDEILVSIAEELGGFVELVGGISHGHCLLEPLESLAAIEETVVRDKAVESTNIIVDMMNDATTWILPMIKRLSEGDWFTSRVSAASLFPTAFKKCTGADTKEELRSMFETLSKDDTPMVRRAIASNLGKLAKHVEKEHLLGFVLPIFKELSTDDQDSVRLLAIENCGTIGEMLNEQENSQHVLPLVRTSMDDRSWRVRFTIAKSFTLISTALGAEITKNELLGTYVLLLQDSEAEVRAAACKNVASYLDVIDQDSFIDQIVPLLEGLVEDAAPNVRGAISVDVMELAPKLGEKITNEFLLPLYTTLLRDEVFDVRLNVLNRIHLLESWAPAMKDTLLPAVVELSRDLQWRVRVAVILTFPSLSKNLGSDYFRQTLLDIYTCAFTDLVSDVRLTSTMILESLLSALGSDWVLEFIVPKLSKIYAQSTIYQERVNVVQAIKMLACKQASEPLLAELTTLAIQAAHDKVPNVRLSSALAIGDLATCVNENVITTQLKPCATELSADKDSDVKQYALTLLESI